MTVSQLNGPIPLAFTDYRITNFRDLRGSATLGMWEVEWSSAEPVTLSQTSLTHVSAAWSFLTEKANI